MFEQRASYDDHTVSCQCGQVAQRSAVYYTAFKIEGQSMPQRDDHESIDAEMKKELNKRNWSADRAIDEMRKAKFEDETGALRIDTRKMSSVA